MLIQLEEKAETADSAAPRKNATHGEKDKPAENKLAASPRGLATNANLDDLWKQTLFLPSRTEDTGESATDNVEEQAELAARNIEFELVGIAQINVVDAEAPAPVAILRSKVGAERAARGRDMRRGNPRDRNARNNPPGPAQPTDNKAKNEEKQVFRVGEKINQTGYTLVSINPDEKMVEVSRNGETVKLFINFTGAEATQRREAANQATERKRQEQARRIEQENRERMQAQNPAQPNATPANPGQPPGPPGSSTAPEAAMDNHAVPGGANTAPTSPDARAERLRRIAEARQARQARQQQSQNTDAPPNQASPANSKPNSAD